MKSLLFVISSCVAFIIVTSCFSKAEKKPDGKHLPSLASDFTFRQLSPEEISRYGNEAKFYYETKLKNTGFNGEIVVAKNGQIVFEDYTGVANFKTRDSITMNTPLHVASTSKTFTGMEIMRLRDQGRLSLSDSIQQYFPDLPYHGITIRMMLSHRSGLPNYLNFMDKDWNKRKMATNQDVLNYMIANKPPVEAMPDKSFHYSNTNFMLLALVVEHITHQPFPQFMKDSLFTPLGMNNTYIFSSTDSMNYVPTMVGNRPYEITYLDGTYGDKNVYTTARDLLQWDRALYQHTFVNKAALDTAFTPQSHEKESKHNYGLAWRIYTNGAEHFVYHNGRWHGSNSSFTRLLGDTATIIVIGNKYNSNIYDAKDMSVIFTGIKDTTNLKE